MLPESGSVLGVDVGWSQVRRSSAACRLDWDGASLRWTIARFTARPEDRQAGLCGVMGTHPLLAAAFDGPLRGDLGEINRYRTCEQILSQAPLRKAIGKLAQSNTPGGRLLNAATNACAILVLEHGHVGPANHRHAIHSRALAEAFPNSFLGLMLSDPAPHKGGRGKRSDRYYAALVADGTLQRLVDHLLPGRNLEQQFATVTDHDDRAALVCALTALCVATGDYSAVGDDDGWIILPPPCLLAMWARPIADGWR